MPGKIELCGLMLFLCGRDVFLIIEERRAYTEVVQLKRLKLSQTSVV